MKFSIRATVFTVLVIIFQILFFVLFITLTDYGEFGMPTWVTNVSFTLNSSLFITDTDVTNAPTATTNAEETTEPPTTGAPKQLRSLPDNPNEYLKGALHRKLKMNKLVTKDSNNYEISHLRPRFFLPPGSEVPPIPSNALEGPYYCIILYLRYFLIF